MHLHTHVSTLTIDSYRLNYITGATGEDKISSIILVVSCRVSEIMVAISQSRRLPVCLLYSVKRSDVTGYLLATRCKQSYVRPPPPYIIVLARSVKILEVIEFHRIDA